MSEILTDVWKLLDSWNWIEAINNFYTMIIKKTWADSYNLVNLNIVKNFSISVFDIFEKNYNNICLNFYSHD